jgi:hypothetical protein
MLGVLFIERSPDGAHIAAPGMNAATEANSNRQRPEISTAAPRQLASHSCHPASRGTRFGVTRRPESIPQKISRKRALVLPTGSFQEAEADFRMANRRQKSGCMRLSASLNPFSLNPLPE